VAEAGRLIKRRFEAPDETRPAGSGKAEVVGLGEVTLKRAILAPGWRWSKDVQPIAKTESCQAAHLNYFLSGRLHVVMDDGREEELWAGGHRPDRPRA
jgi:hypothetical protein